MGTVHSASFRAPGGDHRASRATSFADGFAGSLPTNAIADTATTLSDIIDTKRSLRLEIVVVILIAFEIIVTFYQIWAYKDRAERAEEWLRRITTEIEKAMLVTQAELMVMPRLFVRGMNLTQSRYWRPHLQMSAFSSTKRNGRKLFNPMLAGGAMNSHWGRELNSTTLRAHRSAQVLALAIVPRM